MSVTRNLGFAIILVWLVKLTGEFSFWVLERKSLVVSLEWISARLNALECSGENWEEIDGLMILQKTLGLTLLNAHRQLVYSAVLIILTTFYAYQLKKRILKGDSRKPHLHQQRQ